MNCKHCGSNRTILQGRNIKCKDCNKVFPKIVRRIIVPAEDRPSCPDCGSPNPYSLGLPKGIRSWSCRSCGRFYAETPIEDKVELPVMEVQVE